jgi:hypothetical protein
VSILGAGRGACANDYCCLLFRNGRSCFKYDSPSDRILDQRVSHDFPAPPENSHSSRRKSQSRSCLKTLCTDSKSHSKHTKRQVYGEMKRLSAGSLTQEQSTQHVHDPIYEEVENSPTHVMKGFSRPFNGSPREVRVKAWKVTDGSAGTYSFESLSPLRNRQCREGFPQSESTCAGTFKNTGSQ